MKRIHNFDLFGDSFNYHSICSKKGFCTAYTAQDAPYFGLWIHPFERKIVCYCEGDINIDEAESDEEFTKEVKRVAKFYGEDFLGIDATTSPAKTERFQSLGLGKYLCT